MDITQRKYNRIMMHRIVQYCVLDSDIDESIEFEGVIQNCDFGGLFIETEKALPKGSIIKITFNMEDSEGDLPAVSAIALVKWIKGETGMGISFVEFENIGARDFENWLKYLCDYLKEESSK